MALRGFCKAEWLALGRFSILLAKSIALPPVGRSPPTNSSESTCLCHPSHQLPSLRCRVQVAKTAGEQGLVGGGASAVPSPLWPQDEPSRGVRRTRTSESCFFFWVGAVLGPCCCTRAFSSCGERELPFVPVHGVLIAVASLASEYGL